MSIKDITIVITSFKSDEKIENCLNSIDRQCKVILIENSSDSEFKKNIESNFENVECFLTGNNLGYGTANNIGLKKVKTKYALILNPDATLEDSTLENFFKEANNISDFAIMGPLFQGQMEKNKKFSTTTAEPILVENVKGFAMFLNLEQIRNVGFFDENFFIYFEEIDLCRRLTKANKKIYLAPKIKINHAGGQSHNKSINREMELSRNWHWMWSTFNYHRKYNGFILSLLIVFPKLFSASLKLVFYGIIKNKEKKEIYLQRFFGLINAIMGKSSWYRPKV